ncbi:hypothetical protein QBC35DRAFT_494986 [Podospora australis]|uniref:VOC domain-containing protein n=1 Tax=Podospora australis TaxID=1536484 RepID=A0AAN7AKI5_9PEZI|nr:hypothetical protein QBC35DRAFT_494986 [Podospora australis]
MATDEIANPEIPIPQIVVPKFESVAPVFGTSNLTRWLEHYQALGFQVRRYNSDRDIYGYASRDGIQFHVSVSPDHDPATTAGCAYLYVNDADALHALWSAVPHSGRSVAPKDTDYGLREGAHIDPDGNLLRYGSRISSSSSGDGGNSGKGVDAGTPSA